MANEKPTVVGIGEFLWDLMPSGAEAGGAPANFAAHAAALGVRAILVSAVGNDERGQGLLAHAVRVGLDGRYIQTNRMPTGTVGVEVDAAGGPRYEIHENVAWDAIAWDEALTELAMSADCVCFGTLAQRSFISRSTIQAFVQHTREHAFRICDLNLRQAFYGRQVVEASLVFANVVKMNEEEWPTVAEMMEVSPAFPEGVRELMKRHGISLVALTRGAKGSALVTHDVVDERGGESTKVVDSVGAGDAFTASLAMGLLRGLPLPMIHEAAAKTAAYVCSRSGATPTLSMEVVKLHANAR